MRTVGRWAIGEVIGGGGMARVHLGRPLTAGDGPPVVAIKRLRAAVARDPEFALMFLDEARIATRVAHPNVAATLDVVREEDALALVMEYVHGESLAALGVALDACDERIPPAVASAIAVGVLSGLHAAHETRDESGAPLGVVHRDVSPQNVLVGADGVARVIDFGVAKAARKLHQTKQGAMKGKLAYMAPEQFEREDATRSADVWSASVVLWECLTGERFAPGRTPTQIVEQVLYGRVIRPRALVPDLPPCIDSILARGLARDPARRFGTAAELGAAVRECLPPATPGEVARFVVHVAGPALRDRARLIAAMR